MVRKEKYDGVGNVQIDKDDVKTLAHSMTPVGSLPLHYAPWNLKENI